MRILLIGSTAALLAGCKAGVANLPAGSPECRMYRAYRTGPGLRRGDDKKSKCDCPA